MLINTLFRSSVSEAQGTVLHSCNTGLNIMQLVVLGSSDVKVVNVHIQIYLNKLNIEVDCSMYKIMSTITGSCNYKLHV